MHSGRFEQQKKIARQANELNAIRNKKELIPNDSVKQIRPI